jgi:GH25 family lysozyme M1 (1,4-beta-N-acetylmuramidase)
MINGIDIYHGDELVQQDFITLARQNELYFIFIKATTGGSGKDNRFTSYWDMARKAGLVCGSYHFFWPVTDVTAQVNNFVSQYKLVSRAGVLPPVVDIEWTKVTSSQKEYWNDVPGTKRIIILKDYLQQMELNLNLKPIIYTANSFWRDFITPFSSADDDIFFGSYKLWIADPNDNKRIPKPWLDKPAMITQNYLGDNPPPNATLYQKLDHDVYNGTLKQFLNDTIPGLTIIKGFPFSFIVKDLQAALKTKNFLTDEADGFFGNNTQQAVIDFQNANGLLGNGIVDAQTWNKLL